MEEGDPTQMNTPKVPSDTEGIISLPSRTMGAANIRIMAHFANPFALFTLIGSIPFASGTFSMARCCTLGVRSGDFEKYYDLFYPWEVCNLNKEIDWGTNETFPSIMKPMSWARQFCRGIEYSNTNQWLQPLAAYISPYIGLLLLCPVGEEDPDGDIQEKPLGRFLHALRIQTKEYINILGDPASAVFGAAAEVYADTVALYNISSKSADRQRATWIAALAGALKFSAKTDWHQNTVDCPASEAELMKATAREATTSRTHEVNNLPSCHVDDEETTRAIALCIVARVPFASAILIPVVLMLAVTAATFYDAYDKKGDKDTGSALAYCVWYSWILVPAVAGNSFATALSPDLARRAFEKVMNFGEGKRVIVALRDRHVNNQFWGNWIRQQEGSGKEFEEFVGELRGNVWFWVMFCWWKLMGWCCVAVACGGAAAIAWTTPTVGLGCRSFTLILYGIVAFVNGFLHVFYSWLTVRRRLKREDRGEGILGGPLATLTLVDVVRAVYWLFVVANTLVLVLGTLFYLVGVFRTCWCERLTWNDDTMIELNRKTAEAVENANSYWISTSYVVFSLMTLVCVLAVVLRQLISRRMDEWMGAGKSGGGDEE